MWDFNLGLHSFKAGILCYPASNLIWTFFTLSVSLLKIKILYCKFQTFSSISFISCSIFRSYLFFPILYSFAYKLYLLYIFLMECFLCNASRFPTQNKLYGERNALSFQTYFLCHGRFLCSWLCISLVFSPPKKKKKLNTHRHRQTDRHIHIGTVPLLHCCVEFMFYLFRGEVKVTAK